MPHQRRRVQLIRPGLQLNLIARFFGVALLALLLQFILFMCMLGRIASDMPGDALATMETATPELIWVFVISAAVLLPLTLSVGVVVTFRIAGPLHRFESFLKAVARGEKPPDCRIRRGDELQDLCKLLNEATAPLRRADAPATTLESTRADADRDANARLDSAA
jgi:methyl-accepting chemotaxis protein